MGVEDPVHMADTVALDMATPLAATPLSVLKGVTVKAKALLVSVLSPLK